MLLTSLPNELQQTIFWFVVRDEVLDDLEARSRECWNLARVSKFVQANLIAAVKGHGRKCDGLYIECMVEYMEKKRRLGTLNAIVLLDWRPG